ncbi:uromodulin-like [Macrobrachium rosenbergii]|uniref:uromodulin-like n=1 Tax=Macrobrachium rosenbergii TaxID=79674 RepID=UPI0034D5AAED
MLWRAWVVVPVSARRTYNPSKTYHQQDNKNWNLPSPGISGVISLLETGGIDECSEGSHNCGDHEACTDKLFKYGCSCLPGFARDGLRCEDIDECARGNAECSPHAACSNSVGSYSCSCNRPFKGDGRTCEFSCESPAEVLGGLGCVKPVREWKSWQGMKATCQEAGGRLLQDFSLNSLQEVRRAFGYIGGWIGVYGGKWPESGRAVQAELWWKDFQADPSKPCGFIFLDSFSSLFKVSQTDCSEKIWGFCQIQLS